MSNYFGGAAWAVPFLADQDLTAKQWTHVGAASTYGSVASANSGCDPGPIGVLVNDPSAGQEATVVVFGFVKAKCRVLAGCILRQGAWLKAASDGLFETVGATDSTKFARYFGPQESTTDTSVLGNIFFAANPAACGVNAASGNSYS